MEDILLSLQAHVLDLDRIPVIVAALMLTSVIGMLVGPWAGNANPFVWWLFDAVFGGVGERMDKTQRSRSDLLFRGFLLSVLVLITALVLGQFFYVLTQWEPLWGITRVVLLSLLLAGGAAWYVLQRLYKISEAQGSPQQKRGEGAFCAASRSARVNLAAGDDFGVNRAALGFSVACLDKGVVAPGFWFLIGGFPAAMLYGALAMMVWRFGKKGFTKNFAAIPLALERLMGLIPSFITALLLTLAALFTPTARVHRGIAAWFGAKNRAPYDQGAAPLSVMAWALNVSLGGAYQDLSGSAIQGVWVGPEGASAQVNHKHIKRALYIIIVAHILFLLLLLGLYTWGEVNLLF